jgi:hypothetical protein
MLAGLETGRNILNTTYGLYCSGATPSITIDGLQITNASVEACHFDSCDIDLIEAEIANSPVGINSIASTLDITSSSFLNITSYSLELSSFSSTACLDTVFNRNRLDISSDSTLAVKYSFDMTIIDSNHDPVQGKPVTVSEWAGNTVYSGMSDQQGKIPNQHLNDFTIVNGIKTYCTPHLVWIMGNPFENRFYVAAKNATDLTVFCDGDSDNDTIRDIEERTQYLFDFSASAHAYMPGQIFNDQANGNLIVLGQGDGATFVDEQFIYLNPSYYSVFIKARQTVANTTENLSVLASDGSTTLASDEFTLANNTKYNWYSLDEFQIQSATELRLNISNVNTSSKNILVDNILIVKTKDEFGTPMFSGYFSLPLNNDSDQDGLHDGYDVNDVANGEVSIGTNPMDGDTDNDLLWDGDEVNGYYPEDRLEAEDYFNAIGNVNEKQFSVVPEVVYNDVVVTQFSVNLTIPAQNLFRFKLNGWADLRLQGAEMGNSAIWGPAENATSIALEFELRTLGGNLIQPTSTYKDLDLFNFSKDPDTPGSDYPRFIRYWVQQYDFNLTTFGPHYVNLRLNISNISNTYTALGGPGYVRLFKTWIDHIDVEEFRPDPLDGDRDDDGVIDGLDPVPFNADADKDGLSDAREIENGTNPLSRDTDMDGIRDRVELKGLLINNDPYTIWDTASVLNSDADPNTGTSPTNWDSDGDLLPDGWIDGFDISHQPGSIWETSNLTDVYGNMVVENIEGEDYDGDGIQDIGVWPSGETYSGSADTDNDSMPDGFEVFWYNAGVSLDPLTNDSDDDADNDALTNVQEYVVDTHPGHNNTDLFLSHENDLLLDGFESFVTFRTNVDSGGREFSNYGNLQKNGSYEWIWFKNSTGAAQEFGYSENCTNQSEPDFGGNGNWTIHQYYLDGGTRIEYNRTEQKLYVWQPGADFNDSDCNGIFEGTVWVYAVNESLGQANNSELPVAEYLNREIYLTNALSPDTDGDTVLDGYEGYDGISISDWEVDTDRDGLINARDMDSDGDGILDPAEALFTIHNGIIIYDVDNDGIVNMLDLDSDNDGILDSFEPVSNDTDGDGYMDFVDWDADDDGLPDGWVKQQVYGPYWDTETSSFIRGWISIGDNDDDREIGEGEDLDCDQITDAGETFWNCTDSDSDGLGDGKNWTMHDGIAICGEIDAGTEALDNDTDGDTLLDGVEIYGWNITLINGTGPYSGFRSIHTNSSPLSIDSDNDQLDDNIEYLFTNASNIDTDGDCRGDNLEDVDLDGERDADETDPCDPDSDNDCINDYLEAGESAYPFIGTYSDPLDRDTDGDGLIDGVEASYNGTFNGVANENTPNPRERDSDFDGLSDLQEYNLAMGLSNAERDVDLDGLWNILDPDSDGDHIPDGAELAWDFNSDNDSFESGHSKPNVLDSNSDNEGAPDCWVDVNADGIYNDTEGEVFVMWRTSATDTNDDGGNEYGNGEWILLNIDFSRSGNISFFNYSNTLSALPESINETNHKISETHEGYSILFKNGTNNAYIKKDETTVYNYSRETAPEGVNLTKLPLLPYAISNQERWGGTSPLSSDTDLDGLTDGNEDGTNSSGVDADTDDDGIKDGVESGKNGYQNITSANDSDSDDDGVQDGTESGFTVGIAGTTISIGDYYCQTQGTNISRFVPDADPLSRTRPDVPDSDFDGLPDGWIDGWAYNRSTRTWGKTGTPDGVCQPWEGEENATTVINGVKWGNGKIDSNETNPLLNDTDGDGIPDGWERWYGLDPLNASDAYLDSDLDGLTNIEEFICGTIPTKHYDYEVAWDSDLDGMSDGWEAILGFNTTNPNDGLLDADADGLSNYNEYRVNRSEFWIESINGTWWNGSNPWCNDSDYDKRLDGIEWNISEFADNDLDNDSTPNIFDEDDDGDGVDTHYEISGWNVTYFLSNDTEIDIFVTSDPLLNDTDSDGLDDSIEYCATLNPRTNDTDGDRYSDYFEYNNVSFEPLEVEVNRPWTSDIPGINLREEWDGATLKRCYVHVEINAYDDVGLDKVKVRVFGGIGDLFGLSGISNTTYFNGSRSGFISVDLDVDYWLQRMNEFKVEVTVLDVNNNSFSVINVGGLKKEIVSFFANVVLQFCPEFLGGIYGFFIAFLKNMYDDTIGLISQLPQLWEGITKIGEVFGNFNINKMIDAMGQALLVQAKTVNPYSNSTQKELYDRFNNGFNGGYVTGTILYQILSFILMPGAAIAGALAKVGTALKAVSGFAAVACKVEKIVNGVGTAVKQSKMLISIEKKVGKLSNAIVMKAKNVAQDLAYHFDTKILNRKLGREISEIVAKNGMESSKDLLVGIWKYGKKGKIQERVDDLIRDVGEEATQNTLKRIGKSTLEWSKEEVEGLAKIVRHHPNPHVIKNIDILINTKGIGKTVGRLSDEFKGGKWTESAKGFETELHVAANKIGPSNIVELSPGPNPHYKVPSEEYADILAKNPNRAVNIKNQKHVNCKGDLVPQLAKSHNKYSNHQLVVYVKEIQRNSIQNYLNSQTKFNVQVLAWDVIG